MVYSLIPEGKHVLPTERIQLTQTNNNIQYKVTYIKTELNASYTALVVFVKEFNRSRHKGLSVSLSRARRHTKSVAKRTS